MEWRWTTFEDYLSVLEERPRAIDVAAYVSHGAARLFALGRRALDGGPVSDDDAAAVAAVVGDALEAGALGVSTGRIQSHRMASGRMTPDYGAPDPEVLAVAAAVRAVGGRAVQFATDFHQHLGVTRRRPTSRCWTASPGCVLARSRWPCTSGPGCPAAGGPWTPSFAGSMRMARR
jgi:N-acyl-D-aspartate/D-glutamate deacylase